MLVVSNFPRDNRVHKSARSVAELGHDVTVIWAHPTLKSRQIRQHATFRSIGVPLDYSNRRRVMFESALKQPLRIPNPSKPERLPALRPAGRSVVATVNRLLSLWQEERSSGKQSEKRVHAATVEDINLALLPEILASSPHIIHVQDVQPLAAAFAVQAKYMRSISQPLPIIYDAHEYVAGQVTSEVNSASLWEEIQRRHINDLSAISTVCDEIANRLQHDYSLNQRPSTILNVPDIIPPSSIPNIRDVCEIAAEVPLVVYSGSIAPQRGVSTVIESISMMPGIHLAVICVPGTGTVNAMNLREFARSLKALDRIHFVDPVAPSEVVNYLRGADVGVHPLVTGPINHELALPNKLFDYIHAGLTLTVSNVATMSHFVSVNQLGTVFTSGDIDDCKGALGLALEGRKTGSFATLAPEDLESYTWHAQAHKFEALYAQLDK